MDHLRRPLKRIHDFVSSHYRYAVVGASDNPEKYGHVVFEDLRMAGWNVYPVNPKGKTIAGARCYPTLAAIHPPVDVAVVVVPPAIGLTILEPAKRAGVKKLWFQPGAESADIRAKARTLGLQVQADGSCLMVARRLLVA